MQILCGPVFSGTAAETIIEACTPDEQGHLTIGLEYRNPRTKNKPMTVGELVEFVTANRGYWYEVCRTGNGLHMHAYSDTDMF